MREKKWNKRLVEIADKLKNVLSLAEPAQRLGGLLDLRDKIYDRCSFSLLMRMRSRGFEKVAHVTGFAAGVIGAGLSVFFWGPQLAAPIIFGGLWVCVSGFAGLIFDDSEMVESHISKQNVRADKVQCVVNTLETAIKKAVQDSPEVLKDASLRTRFRKLFPRDLPAANDAEKTEEVFAKAKLSLRK